MFNRRALEDVKLELQTTKWYLNLTLLGYDKGQIRYEYESKYGKLPPDPYKTTEGEDL